MNDAIRVARIGGEVLLSWSTNQKRLKGIAAPQWWRRGRQCQSTG
jgi:hypothetical protein